MEGTPTSQASASHPSPDFCLDLQCTLRWPQALEPVHHPHLRAPGTIPEAEERMKSKPLSLQTRPVVP